MAAAGEKGVILTRAARIKSGMLPPTPLFSEPHSRNKADHKKKSQSLINNSSTSSSSSSDDDNECVLKEVTNRKSQPNTSYKKGKRKRQRVVWVQCDNISCMKWRTLPPGTHIDESQRWYCHMHPDKVQNSCSIPEEIFDLSRRKRFTFSLLQAGQLVWAKMAGFCPWPAIVTPDPWSGDTCHVCEEREGRIYHVEFMGREHTHNWLVEDKVEPYHGSDVKPQQLGLLKNSKPLQRAKEEADQLLQLTPEKRLRECVFQTTSITSRVNYTTRNIENSSVSQMRGAKRVKKRGHGRPSSLKISDQKSSNSSRIGRGSSEMRTVSNQPGNSNTGQTLPSANITDTQSIRYGSTSAGVSESSLKMLLQTLGISSQHDTTVIKKAVSTHTTVINPLQFTPNHNQQVPVIANKISTRCQTQGNTSGFVIATHLSTTAQKSIIQAIPEMSTQFTSTAQLLNNRAVQGRGRGRGRGKGRGRPRKVTSSTRPLSRQSISPTIIDYFKPTKSHYECYQLADEAEDELKEMEDMLALFSPSQTPPNTTVPAIVATTPATTVAGPSATVPAIVATTPATTVAGPSAIVPAIVATTPATTVAGPSATVDAIVATTPATTVAGPSATVPAIVATTPATTVAGPSATVDATSTTVATTPATTVAGPSATVDATSATVATTTTTVDATSTTSAIIATTLPATVDATSATVAGTSAIIATTLPATVTTATVAAPSFKLKVAMDNSIECVMNEMTEIEGLLKDLDGAQLVPYIH